MKKILLATTLCAGLAACNPDKKMVEAVVINTGDITSEGCGYLLVLPDSSFLKPVRLDAAYQHHNMPVLIEYTFSGLHDTCDYGPKVYEMISISKIKRDL